MKKRGKVDRAGAGEFLILLRETPHGVANGYE